MRTQVLIIGGGVVGAGLARDLALRGVDCVLAEQYDLVAGASGHNHGLLHSGARYVAKDPAAAAECCRESALLKRLAPHCIDDCGGLFVALPQDAPDYARLFPARCAELGIPCQALAPGEARDLEPGLNPRLTAAFVVPDASVNPFKLVLDTAEHARALGAVILRFARAEAMQRRGAAVEAVTLVRADGSRLEVRPQQVVIAAGAWSALVAGLAGVSLPTAYNKGSLLVTSQRVTSRVINRLRPAADGDIIVPGGTVSLIGTTSVPAAHPGDTLASFPEVDLLIDEASQMVPSLAQARYIRAFAGVRPLAAPRTGDGREVSRGFVVLEHQDQGLDNLITVIGGKLTTFRLMAEHAADLVCGRLGVAAPCRTAEEPLPPSPQTQWSEPERRITGWLQRREPADYLLCACEMVPASALAGVFQDLPKVDLQPDLLAATLRTRLGKGACQGARCGIRAVLYWYEQDWLDAEQAVQLLAGFVQSRWRGMRPVLWGVQLAQEQLQECIYRGLLGVRP